MPTAYWHQKIYPLLLISRKQHSMLVGWA